MKKIQNARILTNQQMKHISGGWGTFQKDFQTSGGGGACPINATGTDCSGSCDPGVETKNGTCQITSFYGNNYCACVVETV